MKIERAAGVLGDNMKGQRMAHREGLLDGAPGDQFPSGTVVQLKLEMKIAGAQLPLRGRHSSEPNLLLPPAEKTADKNSVSRVHGVEGLGLGLC